MNNSLSFNISCCGYYDKRIAKHNPLDGIEPRIPICYEIEYFDATWESFRIDNLEFPIVKDTIMITKPGCRRLDPDNFRTIYLKLYAEGELARILSSLPTTFITLHTETTCQYMSDIIRRFDEARFTNNFDTHYLLQQTVSIISLIDTLHTDATHYIAHTAHIYPRMHAAKKYIESHYAEHIHTADIADSVFISESRLRSLFRETYHITPHDYLLNTRIMAAKEMLWKNEATFAEIAVSCGFANAKKFSAVFTHIVGMSPREYKKMQTRQYAE